MGIGIHGLMVTYVWVILVDHKPYGFGMEWSCYYMLSGVRSSGIRFAWLVFWVYVFEEEERGWKLYFVMEIMGDSRLMV